METVQEDTGLGTEGAGRRGHTKLPRGKINIGTHPQQILCISLEANASCETHIGSCSESHTYRFLVTTVWTNVSRMYHLQEIV